MAEQVLMLGRCGCVVEWELQFGEMSLFFLYDGFLETGRRREGLKEFFSQVGDHF